MKSKYDAEENVGAILGTQKVTKRGIRPPQYRCAYLTAILTASL